MEKVIIFDTTLRDGEQSPGASLTPKEKLEIAKQLARLGVDVIEAGYPASSPGEVEAVKEICRQVRRPIIAGLARSVKRDIDVCAEALKDAKYARIHVFLATSRIHMKYKLKKAKDEILRMTQEYVRYAKRFCEDVEFSPEDASRTEPEFLFKVVEAAIDAGATTINIPDTVGYATPDEFGALIRDIRATVQNIDRAKLSVHCHNDLGLATANSLAAVCNGVQQVECTVNGIGERAGNTSLEEVVMTMLTRRDLFDKTTNIVTQEIIKTSHLVSHLTGMLVQPNKAIVGQNAFRHEAGIHQDGILKRRTTYEIMDPRSIGLAESKLVLGKHSGRHAFKERLQKLGYDLSPQQLGRAFERFKEIADRKKEVFDDDLKIMVEDEITEIPKTWDLDYLNTTSGTKTVPTATVRLKRKEKVFEDAACGDGPVDACYRTIDRITGLKPGLLDYSLKAVTGGKEALGEVTVKLEYKGRTVIGRGASTDIIEASAKAYLNAINKLVYKKR